MAQKSLCGHSKGGSAAWQLAGLLQSVYSGIVLGNRNAEYVFEYIAFTCNSHASQQHRRLVQATHLSHVPVEDDSH